VNGVRPPDPPLSDGVVTLRPPNQSDRATIVAACQDPEIPRWTLVPEPYADSDAGAFLAMADAGWSVGIGAFFAVTQAIRPDHLIGLISLDLPRTGPSEVGYWMSADGRGRGHATRALRLVSDWAIGELGVDQILLKTLIGNVGSERVAAKAGYLETGSGVCHQRGVDRPNRVWQLTAATAQVSQRPEPPREGSRAE
jgi:RimJ/RimL family protein N-acetyltransferase